MCCEPQGTEDKIVGTCPKCGSDVDADGVSNDICAYSPEDCDLCGCAPCDDSC